MALQPVRRRTKADAVELCLILALCAAFYFLTGHDDLLETSNHAWLLLDCIKSGRLREFYNVVMAHENTLYYVNNAHYSIVCYLLYALWQLPVYVYAQLSGAAVSEIFRMFWSKAVGVGAYLVCAVLLQKIAAALGFADADAHSAAAMFLLHPVAFFAALVMGQYDSLCLCLLLAALLAWVQKRYVLFSLWTGAALVFKFFPLLLFLPLLVLIEKRPVRCIGYALCSLWLYVPTALFFRGRTGDMGVFNNLMIERIFASKLPGGLDDIPVFLLLYAVLLAACYFYRPRTDTEAVRLMPWLGLCVFGLLFLTTLWHPQWLILLAPFCVLTTLCQTQRAPWLYLENVFFLGYWLCLNFNFPGHLEANLLLHGWLSGVCAGLSAAHNTLVFYLQLLPWAVELSPVLFAAPLAAAIVLKCPVGGISVADRLAARSGSDTPLAKAPSQRVLVFGTFVFCILGVWLCSALFVALKAR